MDIFTGFVYGTFLEDQSVGVEVVFDAFFGIMVQEFVIETHTVHLVGWFQPAKMKQKNAQVKFGSSQVQVKIVKKDLNLLSQRSIK